MKELSINEKAKRYDEAIEKLRSLHDDYDTVSTLIDIKEELENIFPELKESEDERIRKWIIDDIRYNINNEPLYESEYKKQAEIAIAWLEKQGKEEYALKSFKDEDVRKFMQYIEKEAKAYEFNLPNRGYDIYAFAKDILVWLEKQSEQKPILRERYENIAKSEWFKRTHDGMSVSDDEESKWSEENDDDALLNDIISKIENGCQLNRAEIDWLKSIKEKLHKQKSK